MRGVRGGAAVGRGVNADGRPSRQARGQAQRLRETRGEVAAKGCRARGFAAEARGGDQSRARGTVATRSEVFAAGDDGLVSLNAGHKINPEKTLREFTYAHPIYSAESSAAQGRRTEICGHNRTHFCGAYWYNGFHEDGVRSALDVANRFGQSL